MICCRLRASSGEWREEQAVVHKLFDLLAYPAVSRDTD